MEWISLILAGCCEVFGISMMNVFKKKKNIQVILLIILSFGMKTLPMGISYAIWTGIGGVGAAQYCMVNQQD